MPEPTLLPHGLLPESRLLVRLCILLVSLLLQFLPTYRYAASRVRIPSIVSAFNDITFAIFKGAAYHLCHTVILCYSPCHRLSIFEIRTLSRKGSVCTAVSVNELTKSGLPSARHLPVLLCAYFR
ncbi:hypothetical protein EDD18DRAFT_1196289 [Armillaria luteobubalina]|uniref:Uncharacterized protein n=1 Tax=Armillaria luteobubalina TaxID=153913 RepID=A0AA39TFB2_9AGAR|nr:hypothetical protein EDD18DRAFT_1196289 [Armillaria luteobubalina]